jgi:excisionase family DNA binding protein
MDKLLTPAEVGEILGVHPKTVMRLAARGELPGRRVGRYWRFAEKNIAAWIDRPTMAGLAFEVPTVALSQSHLAR